MQTAAGFSHTDSQCGFKAWRGEAAKAVFSLCETDGWAFDIEALMIAEKLGYRVTETAVSIMNHSDTSSKVKPVRDTVRMLRDLTRIKARVKKIEGPEGK